MSLNNVFEVVLIGSNLIGIAGLLYKVGKFVDYLKYNLDSHEVRITKLENKK